MNKTWILIQLWMYFLTIKQFFLSFWCLLIPSFFHHSHLDVFFFKLCKPYLILFISFFIYNCSCLFKICQPKISQNQRWKANKFKTQNTWGSVKNRPPTDSCHPSTASQVSSRKKDFFPPSLQRDKITINQEKGMSVFDSFTLPSELGKIVEK